MTALVLVGLCLGSGMTGGITSDQLDQQVAIYRKHRQACGPTSACYCLTRLGHKVALEEMISKATLTDQGIRVNDLLHLIRSSAPSSNPRALIGKPQNVESLPVPSILFVDNHSVVFDGVDPDTGQIRIFEPVTRKVTLEAVDNVYRYWSGEAICFADPQMSPRAYFAAIVLISIIVASPGVWLLFLRPNHARAAQDEVGDL